MAERRFRESYGCHRAVRFVRLHVAHHPFRHIDNQPYGCMLHDERGENVRAETFGNNAISRPATAAPTATTGILDGGLDRTVHRVRRRHIADGRRQEAARHQGGRRVTGPSSSSPFLHQVMPQRRQPQRDVDILLGQGVRQRAQRVTAQ